MEPEQATNEATAPEANHEPGRAFRFTAENAADMARRSHEKREAKRALLMLELQREMEPAKATADDDYVSQRVARVRSHIAQTDAALQRASEPLDRERLARALAALSELERVLSGRPTPGQLRPRSTPRQLKPDAEQVG